MIVTLQIRDEDNFSGHPVDEIILGNMDRLLRLIENDLSALDPNHHRYTVKREA